MNKIAITIGGLLLLGTLAAAFINSMPKDELVRTVPMHPAATTTQDVSLVGTTWLWNNTVDHKGDRVSPEDSNEFQLTFSEDGELSSTTDCNSLGGTYVVNGEVLSVGPLVATEMYCNEKSLEQAYAGRLSLVSSYDINGDVLTLILVKDAGTMSFKAKR